MANLECRLGDLTAHSLLNTPNNQITSQTGSLVAKVNDCKASKCAHYLALTNNNKIRNKVGY